MSPPLIEFREVSVQRGDRLALDRLNLTIQTGEHVAVLGPNGSGKSTLIKLITRECYPLQQPGSVLRILGQDNWNIFELRSFLGIVSNDLMSRCTRDITGRELVLSGFFGSIGIWPNHEVQPYMETAAAEAMEQLQVEALASRWLDELSSGEARRLLIARALIHKPPTLLLDEPTTSLDFLAQRNMRDQLRLLANAGVSLILVTHHLEEVMPEIDRVVLLSKGTVHFDGPKREALTSARLSSVFQGTVQITVESGTYHAW